jgi:hypothetical protein
MFGLLTVPLRFLVTYIRRYEQCKQSNMGIVTLALHKLFFPWVALGAVGPNGREKIGVLMGIDPVPQGRKGS